MSDLRVAHGLGKFVIVEGVKPLVGPVGSLEELEAAVKKIVNCTIRETYRTAVDIFLQKHPELKKASA